MTHSGGQPHSSVGDMGQRYEIRCHGYPKPGVNTIGWSNDLKGARRMREIIGQAPGCTATEVYDRQEKCFDVDQGTLVQQLLRNAAAEDHRGAGGLMSEAAAELVRLEKQCRDMANVALGNGNQLLHFERALIRIKDLADSEAGEPLDEASQSCLSG